MGAAFLVRLASLVDAYLERAGRGEHLSLLRWQIREGHALENRETYPGHITTSAIIFSPNGDETLLIDHKTIGRWLQPGGHYEPADFFWQSALREGKEETGLSSLSLHPWHQGQDYPFVIDSHDVPGKASRREVAHIHHDLQYLFMAPREAVLTAQIEEVHAAQWHPITALREISPKAWRLRDGAF